NTFPGIFFACARRGGNRRYCDSEPWHARREYCECVAGSRFASGASRLRRSNRVAFHKRLALAALSKFSHRIQKDEHAPRRINSRDSLAARDGRLEALLQKSRNASCAGNFQSL